MRKHYFEEQWTGYEVSVQLNAGVFRNKEYANHAAKQCVASPCLVKRSCSCCACGCDAQAPLLLPRRSQPPNVVKDQVPAVADATISYSRTWAMGMISALRRRSTSGMRRGRSCWMVRGRPLKPGRMSR